MPAFALLALVMVVAVEGKSHFTLGFLAPLRHPRLAWDSNAAAATMAIERAQSEGILADKTFSVVYRNDNCDGRSGVGQTARFRDIDDVDMYLGPGCSQSAKSAGLLASFWNMPMFSPAATDPELSDKSKYTTLVRTSPAFSKMGAAVLELFSYFNWTTTVILSERRVNSRNVFCDYASRSIQDAFYMDGKVIPDLMEFNAGISIDDIDSLLSKVKHRARIVLLCGPAADEHNFLKRAHAAGMATDEYLYITLDHFRPSDIFQPWRNDPSVQFLYQRVIEVCVASALGTNFEDFLDEIPRRMAEPPWNDNTTLLQNKTGSIYAAFLYDVTYLYLLALNETLSSGGDPRDGIALFNNAKKQSFKGITGEVSMDDNADRHPDYWVLRPNANNSEFYIWLEVGMAAPSGQRINVVVDAPWNTANGMAPRDIPRCGFFLESCPIEDSDQILIYIIPTLIVIISAIIGTFVMLRIRKKAEDQSMMWKIDYSELSLVNSRRGGSMSTISTEPNDFASVASLTASNKVSKDGSVLISDGNAHKGVSLYTDRKVASYRGNLVTVQVIDPGAIEMDKITMKELSNMSKLLHENINLFIGLTEAPNICIVTGFCSKGSLQDIIANDDICLDWLFKYSLMLDLLHGLHYIHSSTLHFHGNLTSDSCFIDNRWVLKISDYGLMSVCRHKIRPNEIGEYERYREKLWTAPEILKAQSTGSPEADIYAYGVILYELIFRCLPYGCDTINDLTPKEICARVVAGEKPPFRPTTMFKPYTESDPENKGQRVIPLMEACWEESPSSRARISDIKRTLKSFNHGRSINIVDNMVTMMEKYANSLEELVESRTSELVDQKKKTDILLYSMLPKSVADVLKKGQTVIPEHYDDVTIFFSDIKGFTSMSSSSTPFQVINLLNDLYTLFDTIIATHDVYKVETIGDAYMVVSGLPERNGDKHVFEITNMALDLLSAVYTKFKIRHRPDERLLLRIGIHSGPCVAGVVGLKMPRFCLFGDTVNVSSRMESTGKELKIHISDTTAFSLMNSGLYNIVPRGEIIIKGKGARSTFWVTGREGYEQDLPPPDTDIQG